MFELMIEKGSLTKRVKGVLTQILQNEGFDVHVSCFKHEVFGDCISILIQDVCGEDEE